MLSGVVQVFLKILTSLSPKKTLNIRKKEVLRESVLIDKAFQQECLSIEMY